MENTLLFNFESLLRLANSFPSLPSQIFLLQLTDPPIFILHINAYTFLSHKQPNPASLLSSETSFQLSVVD